MCNIYLVILQFGVVFRLFSIRSDLSSSALLFKLLSTRKVFYVDIELGYRSVNISSAKFSVTIRPYVKKNEDDGR